MYASLSVFQSIFEWKVAVDVQEDVIVFEALNTVTLIIQQKLSDFRII